MHKTIVSDTSCIILLERIGELELLHQLFGTIIITTEVANEFGLTLPTWFEIKQPSNKKYQSILEASVDKGEASAIALAIELGDCLLIIDDFKGRKFARRLGLMILGTLGIIVELKLAGLIPSVKPMLTKIKQTNFRITEKLEIIILNKAGDE